MLDGETVLRVYPFTTLRNACPEEQLHLAREWLESLPYSGPMHIFTDIRNRLEARGLKIERRRCEPGLLAKSGVPDDDTILLRYCVSSQTSSRSICRSYTREGIRKGFIIAI